RSKRRICSHALTRASKIYTTPPKSFARGADASPRALNFIVRRQAPRRRRALNPLVTGRRLSVLAQFRGRLAAAHASGWAADWCKQARLQSAPPIGISKGAWAIATR